VYDAEGARADLKAAQEQARYEAMTEKDLGREIKRLEKQMLDHARNLEFEKAAAVRDQLATLKRAVFGAEGEQPPAREASA
jgi:excinuclease ABC subunit B